MNDYGYPADHDPVLPAIMEAASMARIAGNRNARVVLDALLQAYEGGTVDQLAWMVETYWRPQPDAERAMREAAAGFVVAGDEDCPW